MASELSTETKFDLSKVEDVRTYLESTPFASTEITPLSGGNANYVFRLWLKEPHEGRKTLVLKHAKSYARVNQEIALDVGRQFYEVQALRRVRAWLPPDSTAIVPAVHLFDEKVHAIVMDDAGVGSVDLKTFMKLPPSSGGPTPAVATQIGVAVGIFMGSLHKWGRENTELLEVMTGNEMGRRISAWLFYESLPKVLATGGMLPKLLDPLIEVGKEDLEAVERISAETVQTILDARDSFVMGDFWPGNMMVVVNEQGGLQSISVVDWELAKTGVTGIEVGQFCAEIHLLRRCYAENCKETASLVLEHFFREYVRACKPDAETARRAVVQWGTHMAVLGASVDWGDKEISRAVVLEGVRILVDGYSAGEPELKRSFVGAMVV